MQSEILGGNVMSGKRTFEIPFVGLKLGTHDFIYEITDKFFIDYDEQDFKNCKATIKLTLDKHSSFMLLKFEVGGNLEVGCDRCGNNLPMQLWDEFNTVIKLVENPDLMNEEEEDPDVHYISRTESHIDVADWLFEFINLSIPMQRMCSEAEIGGPFCNKEVLAKLNEMKPKEKEPSSTNLWKGLDKFKGLGEESISNN